MPNTIGRFQLLSEISRSQVGSVYKATDTTSNETVALKTIKLESLGEQSVELVKRILEEADKSKVLNSQNIALLYGAGEIEGQFCASMEYVQGNSIGTMLARKEGFSIWDLQDIARQACQGLDHAQSHGLAHHSLEPAKVMVQWDGMVKILAFGVSSMGEYAVPASGAAPELLHYMSPEQFRREPIDIRSNLFSLGAIVYEMLTDKKAFGGVDADSVRLAICESVPASPHQVIAKIPQALSAVIMKALAQSPEDRYQSGKELLIDLEKSKSAPAKAVASVSSALGAKSTPQVSNARPGASSRPASKAAAVGVSTLVTNRATSPTAPSNRVSGPPSAGSSSVNFSSSAITEPKAPMSSVAESETQAPRIAIDPLVDESREQARSQSRSFSDIDELPPLKEVLVRDGPAPSSSPCSAADLRPPVLKKPVPHREKVKIQPGVMARKAATEIKKTPPKLFLYAMGGAVAIIVLVIGILAFHFSSESSEEQNTPAQTQAKLESGSRANTAQTVSPEPMSESGSPVLAVAPNEDKSKRRSRTSAPTTPTAVPAQLNVNSSPEGAQFQIDGRQDVNWITPFNVAGLASGQHTVNVTKPGYKPETRSVDISAGAKSVFVVQLEALFAIAVVESEPAGAAVFMDGRDTGRVTPIQIRVDVPGPHTLLLKKQGYLEETATADLQSGQTIRLDPTLKVLGNTDDVRVGGKFKKLFGGGDTAGMASIIVKTQPKGAQVAVNRHVLDKNSPVEFHLEPGNYVIDITLSGYKSIHKVVTLERNGKESIDETLERE